MDNFGRAARGRNKKVPHHSGIPCNLLFIYFYLYVYVCTFFLYENDSNVKYSLETRISMNIFGSFPWACFFPPYSNTDKYPIKTFILQLLFRVCVCVCMQTLVLLKIHIWNNLGWWREVMMRRYWIQKLIKYIKIYDIWYICWI